MNDPDDDAIMCCFLSPLAARASNIGFLLCLSFALGYAPCMIGKLKGIVDSIDDDSLLLDVGGVGYHVFCSGRTLSALPAAGEAVALITETHIREDHFHLYGFPNTIERDWFRLLMTVQGVGAKMALAILNVFAPAELVHAIAAKDLKSLQRVSGVGGKLAERLATELKSKVGSMATGDVVLPMPGKGASALPPISPSEDALSALLNLGYSRAEAYKAVQSAVAQSGEQQDIGKLVSNSLKLLSRQ